MIIIFNSPLPKRYPDSLDHHIDCDMYLNFFLINSLAFFWNWARKAIASILDDYYHICMEVNRNANC